MSGPLASLSMELEQEQEEDGRWLAEIPELPGVLAYGASPEEAKARATALALHVLAERIEHGEATPVLTGIANRTGLSPRDLR